MNHRKFRKDLELNYFRYWWEEWLVNKEGMKQAYEIIYDESITDKQKVDKLNELIFEMEY